MSRATRLAALGAAAVLLAACSPGAREAQPFEGVWRSDAFDLYLHVHGGDADIYEYSAAHCARVYGGPARGISDVLSFDGDRLLFTDSGRVISFDRADALAPSCFDDYWTDEGARVVAVTAATVEELYNRPLDTGWSDRVAAASASVVGSTDHAAIFEALTGLLGPLADPGMRLAVADPSVWAGVWAAGGGPFAGRTPYLPAGMTGPEVSGDDGIVAGTFGSVGYIGLSRIGGFAAADDAGQLVLADALDGVLAGSGSVIIDLRAASSGRAVEAMLVASRFVRDNRTVATQTLGGTAAGALTVSPVVGGPYSGRVVLLTGPGTAGAAEMLVLAMRSPPRVTVVGEPTAGSPTPPLARTLPNGWSLGVPALDLATPDGGAWAGVPIIPDVDAAITTADLIAGTDPGIAAALASLG